MNDTLTAVEPDISDCLDTIYADIRLLLDKIILSLKEMEVSNA